jgi:hypothetical protein
MVLPARLPALVNCVRLMLFLYGMRVGTKLDAELPPFAKRTWLTVVHQSLLGLIQPCQVSCIWLQLKAVVVSRGRGTGLPGEEACRDHIPATDCAHWQCIHGPASSVLPLSIASF